MACPNPNQAEEVLRQEARTEATAAVAVVLLHAAPALDRAQGGLVGEFGGVRPDAARLDDETEAVLVDDVVPPGVE